MDSVMVEKPVWSAQVADLPGVGALEAGAGAAGEAGMAERLLLAGRAFLSGWTPLMQHLSRGTMREKDVLARVAVDRATLGRVMRAVRSGEPMRALHLAPSPTGLELFLEAIGRAAPGRMVNAAREAFEPFAALVSSLPAGRVSLDGLMAGLLPEARARAASTARQSAFRAMATLLGYEAQATSAAMFLRPAADGRACDALHVLTRYGLQRSRAGGTLGLFGMRADADDHGEAAVLRGVEPLGGPGSARDPAAYFLPGWCAGRARLHALRRTGDELMVCIPGDSPEPGELVNIAYGQVTRGQYQLAPGSADEVSWYEVLPRVPTPLAVVDLFLDRRLWTGAVPLLTARMPGLFVTERPRRLADVMAWQARQPDTVMVDDALVFVQTLRREAAGGPSPGYGQLLRDALATAGWDDDSFVGYRLSLRAPLMSVYHTLWFQMPGAGTVRGV